MKGKSRMNDSVLWYMNEKTSSVVAESGIPSDRFHMGKLILQGLRDDPDFILQIDGATGKSETNQSVLQRSIRCAIGLSNLGLKPGDVIALSGPNHLDLAIPLYAAFYLGLAVAPVDITLGVGELVHTLKVNNPKMIFCQNNKTADIMEALKELKQDSKIVTFDKGDHISFNDFIEDTGDDSSIDNFKATNFNPEEMIMMLIPTSGTTGLPKSAALSYKNIATGCPYFWVTERFPMPALTALVVSPLQWLTALIHYILAPINKYTRLQSSLESTEDHVCYLINTYKPDFLVSNPTLIARLLRRNDDSCNFSCFKTLMLGGSAVSRSLVEEVKSLSPETDIINVYGMSELSTTIMNSKDSPLGSCGKVIPGFECKLVNIDTGEDIDLPNITGELWVSNFGRGLFKGYYNNPKATKEVFSSEGWFKTGDIFYKDENDNYFFVDRMKVLLKYKNNQIAPTEVEFVIRQHSGVSDVAVAGIPDLECGDLPVACVERRPGYELTADIIKDLVKESLADYKQLRGGVIFMDRLPRTVTGKVDRRKLKEVVLTMKRE